jgi:GTP pyrophosphokinase
VDWEPTDSLFPVNILVDAWDRVGLIRDITTIVAEEGLNITTMTSTPQDGHKVAENFTLQARDLSQLSRLMAKIDGIRGVIGVSRIGDEATTKTKPSTKEEKIAKHKVSAKKGTSIRKTKNAQ